VARAGRPHEARAVLDAYGVTAAAVQAEPFPFAGAFQLAVTALELHDVGLATSVAEALGPYRSLWGHFFLAPFAPVGWALALCATVTGDLDRAVELMAESYAAVERAGYVGYLGVARCHFAATLAARGAPGDRERARELATAARSLAGELGEEALLARATALLDDIA
jgi:hypothetical protein